MVAKKITKIKVIDESDDSEGLQNKGSKKAKKASAKSGVVKTPASTEGKLKKETKNSKKTARKKTTKTSKKLPAKRDKTKRIVKKASNKISVRSKKKEEEKESQKDEDIVRAALKEAEELNGKKVLEKNKKEISGDKSDEEAGETTEQAIVSPVAKVVKEENARKENKIIETEEPIGQQENEEVVPDSENEDGQLNSSIADVNRTVDQSAQEEEDSEVEEVLKQKISASRSVKLYRKIAYFFIILTIVLIAIVSYYSFVKVTIMLVPNQERISNNMIFDVYDADAGAIDTANAITGIVKLKEIEHEISYAASGKEVIGKEAIGKVTIINNYSKNQPLVATTRLLSPDGKLYRLSDTVNVPAGGSVEASISADEPSEEMAIGPTTFTIPGLWAGLQDKIYAKSNEPVVYQQKAKKYVVQDDVDDSIRELKQKLLLVAKEQINQDYKDYGQIIYKIDENSTESEIDAEVGDEIDEFTASMVADVIVVAFDDDKSAELAKQKFVSSLLKNKELLSFDEENIIYSLNNYDHVEGVATINATFEGKVSLKEDSGIVEIDRILGLNNKQLDAYLAGLPEIAGFEVEYFPSFIKRVPKLVDRVEIKIKK